jgi:hypothetical protein
MRCIGKRRDTLYTFEAWLHDKQIKLDTNEPIDAELSKEQTDLMDRALEQAKQRKLKELSKRGNHK